MKSNYLRGTFYGILLSAILITQTGCPGAGKEMLAPPDLSAADKMAGTFSGTGKYLPGGVSLGNTSVCTPAPVSYQSKYQAGIATVNVVKLTDTTVTITLLTGPFPLDKFASLKLIPNGNMISFGSLGYYDTNTKTLVFSGVAPNFSYSYIRSCQVGLPYYYSTGVILYPYPDQVGHFTIKRYEFTGVKQ